MSEVIRLAVLHRLLTQEYAMARMLGYSAADASMHVYLIKEDYKRICELSAVRK